MSVSDSAQSVLIQSVNLDRAALAYALAHIERGAQPVITTAAQRWSYAASLPLGLDPAGGPDLAVEVRLRVIEGKVGVGVLAADEQSFVVGNDVAANRGRGSCLVLRLPCPPVVGPLIVRNVSETGPSKVILEEVAICRLPSSSALAESAGSSASEPAQEELARLVRSLEYLRPLVPYPGWHFDCDWNHPDFSFQTRRRLWEYCCLRGWNVLVDLPWYGGLRVELPLLSDAGRQLFVGGCIDPNEFAFLDRILKPGMVFVDVGAHLGLYTLFAAQRNAAVWAFEPSSREFASLQRNIQSNHLDVQTLQLALGNTDTRARLYIADSIHSGQNTFHAFLHEGVASERAETVEVRRLDRIVEERDLPRIDVLKVDVEQSEAEVFEGAGQVLRSMQPWVLVEVPPASGEPANARGLAWLELLHGLGYTFYAFDRTTGLPVDAQADFQAGNLLASPMRKPFPEEATTARRYYFRNGAGAGR